MKTNSKKVLSLFLAFTILFSSFNLSYAKSDSNPKKYDKKVSKILEEFLEHEPSVKSNIEKSVYIVDYDSSKDKSIIKTAINSIKDTKIIYEYDILFNAFAVETTLDNIDKIKSIKGVKSVEKSGKLEPLMENARVLIGTDKATDYLKSIKATNPEIAKSYDGRGMVIANIDTGMDASHKAMRLDDDAKETAKIKYEDLSPTDKEFYISEKVPHSFNYFNGGKITIEKYDDGSDYYDPHGMHIAGILAANDTKSDVEAGNGIRGIAPNAQLFSYKMYSDSSNNFAGDETMFHAFEDSIKHDVDVISISSGFTGTGLNGEKYWEAIRALRNAGIPVCVATGNFATSSSSSSWDRYANNALNMIDTGNVTRTAAHEDAIAVGSSRNTKINFNAVKIGDKEFRYSRIGAFFDKNKFNKDNYSLIYLGKCQDEDIAGKDLRDKIVIMDRIYTKDLKYAFKKVADKGAKGVIVVNTVSYYNRDDWENVPAMGYEQDEATNVSVISVSGMDGLEIWNMITGNNNTDVKSKEGSDYRIDMDKYNSSKPNVGDEKLVEFKLLDKKIPWDDVNVPAGSTSWGPRIDLMLKPDISAPGKNIYSTLNKINGVDTYQYLSGTSMATPIISASTVIIRPKAKEMLKESVIKNRGTDLTSLIKIMLQNTATPMIDPTTDDKNGGYLYASPRQQGAGQINLEKAIKNNLIISHDLRDSKGLINQYGTVSLKEIKGASKDFTINIDNTSDRDITLKVSSSAITTDENTKTTKLDEEYKDENSVDGKKIVAEVHPKKIENAKLNFSQEEITIPAKGSFSLGATLEVGDALNKNQFVEGFIKFDSLEEIEGKIENPQPSLNMAFMGFAGNWNSEPILDKWSWEDGSRAKTIMGHDEDGNPKIPGTLNRGHGGDGIDYFKPAGIIQNTEDGNKNYNQDPDYFSLNNNLDFMNDSTSGDSDIISKYAVETTLTPSPLILRSASDAKISIVDSTKSKDLKVLQVDHFIRGILNSKSGDSKGVKGSALKVYSDLRWDGEIYNPRAVDKYDESYIEGKLEPISEGDYYFKFKYRLTPDYPYQESYIPVKIDTTRPRIVSFDASNPDEIILKVKDSYYRQKKEYQNETLFRYDQDKSPEKFEEISNKVWFTGAAVVDEDGEILENLKVINQGDKNKYGGFELDSEGNTVYKILGANNNLAGKTIEIAALDGALNFTDSYKIKFDDTIKDGKLGYSRITSREWDDDNYEWVENSEKIGEIDKNLLKDIKNNDTNEENPNEIDTPSLDGTPIIEIDKEKSTIIDLKDEDTKRIIKPKEIKTTNPFTGYESIDLDYGDESTVDEYGIPTHYKDGSKMEFKDNSVEDLKNMGYVGKVVLTENKGFDIEGYVKNVSKDAKIYFVSSTMSKTGKRSEVKKLISTYDESDKSMKFNLWGNIDDIDNRNGIDYKGDLEFYVRDTNGVSKSVFVRMPKLKNEAVEKKKDPVESSFSNVTELGESDLNSKLIEKKDENGNIYYEISDRINIEPGYGLRIISRNPGKTDLEALSRLEYINNTDSSMDINADIKVLQGFNILRYEIYKLVDGKLNPDDSNLSKEVGKIIFIDKDRVSLKMDENFNPYNSDNSPYGELYVKNSPVPIRGTIFDKGGFNWHLRINESMIDQYLVFGDLKSDNSRDFEAIIEAKDGDIMDWAAKDYNNGMAEGFRNQYKIYIDNVKPEISVVNEPTDIALNLSNNKNVNISITDKRDNGKPGRIMEKSILVNNKEYDPSKSLNDYKIDNENEVEVKISATDYARNTKVEIFKINLETGDDTRVENPYVIVTIDGKEVKVKKGEDFTLPEFNQIEPPYHRFIGYKVGDEIKKPSVSIIVNEDITITSEFSEDIIEKEKNQSIIRYEKNMGSIGISEIKDIKVEKGSEYTLLENPFTPPEKKRFKGYKISGKDGIKMPNEKIIVDDNIITITALWENIEEDNNITPPIKPNPEDYPRDFNNRTYPDARYIPRIIGSETIPSVNDSKTNYLDSYWAKDAIRYSTDKGYFKDIADIYDFKPTENITRAEFVTILGRMANIDTKKYMKISFNDINPSKYYAPYIEWASKNKITLGNGDGGFNPDSPLTREQMATFIDRYNKLVNLNLKDSLNKNIYKDDSEISQWAKNSVYEMTRLGVVKGNDENKFMPKQNLTRAEIAQIMFNIK